MTGVRETYDRELAMRGYRSDPGQLAVIEELERCADDWAVYLSKRSSRIKKLIHRPEIPRGVYMYGGVGRGKSFLMDCFYNAVGVKRKTRLHFHEFMREVHRQLALLQGTVDPLDALARQMARKYRLICFDEFHVADITDAMILHRLLDALFAQGVGFVTTSNFRPDDLYPNGLHRARILPAIALLNDKLAVMPIGDGTDYRLRALEDVVFYHVPNGPQADAAMARSFERLAEAHDEDPVLHIEARQITARRRAGGVGRPRGRPPPPPRGRHIEARQTPARRRAGGVVWFDFKVLCGGPRSQNDYLEIATQFHTVLLSDVPQMPQRMASEARRFTWLVDVLYDRRVKLILSAAVAPERLYTEGPLAHEFVRTVSRLREMQTQAFMAQERRMVDTALT